MKQQSKFSQEQQTETHRTHQQIEREFANSDELLRVDAAKIVVPLEIGRRLNRSIREAAPVPPRRSWWKNLFGQ